jgi:hypothetical protein
MSSEIDTNEEAPWCTIRPHLSCDRPEIKRVLSEVAYRWLQCNQAPPRAPAEFSFPLLDDSNGEEVGTVTVTRHPPKDGWLKVIPHSKH